VRTCLLLFLFASSLLAFGQSGDVSAGRAAGLSQPSQSQRSAIKNQEADELKQELDADAKALSKIPADPLIHPDPVAPILRPVEVGPDVEVSVHPTDATKAYTKTLLGARMRIIF
jgi:porin